MAEIVAAFGALLTVGQVISTVLSIFATVLSVLQGAAIIIYIGIKILITLVTKFFNVILVGGMLFVQGTLGFLFYRAKPLAHDLTTDKFDDNPIRTSRLASSASIIDVIAVTIETIRNTIFDLLTFLGPAIALAPWTVLFTVGFFIALYLSVPLQPLTLILVDWTLITFANGTHAIAFVLNNLRDFLITITPAWNGFARAALEIGQLLFALACSGPASDDLSTYCPAVYQVLIFLKFQWDYYVTLLQIGWSLLTTFLVALGGIVCPGGICPAALCLKYSGSGSCVWRLDNPTFIIRYLLGIFQELLTSVLYLSLLGTFFVFDMMVAFYTAFSGILRRYIPASAVTTLNNFLINPNRQTVSSFAVPADLQGLKDFDVLLLAIATKLFLFLSNAIDFGFAFIDGILCNIFIEPLHCLGDKLCKAYLKPFSFLGSVVNMPKILCKDVLGINWNPRCLYSCDRCEWLPFGLKLDLVWWYEANTFYTGFWDKGNSYTPCVPSTQCCNYWASLLSRIWPAI